MCAALLLGDGGGIPGDREPGRGLGLCAICGRTCGATVERVKVQLMAPLPSSRSTPSPLHDMQSLLRCLGHALSVWLRCFTESAQVILHHTNCCDTFCKWSSCSSKLGSMKAMSPDPGPTSHSTSHRFLLSGESFCDSAFSLRHLIVVMSECAGS